MDDLPRELRRVGGAREGEDRVERADFPDCRRSKRFSWRATCADDVPKLVGGVGAEGGPKSSSPVPDACGIVISNNDPHIHRTVWLCLHTSFDPLGGTLAGRGQRGGRDFFRRCKRKNVVVVDTVCVVVVVA